MGTKLTTKRAVVGLLIIAALGGACGKDKKTDDASGDTTTTAAAADATTTTAAGVKTGDVMLGSADNNSTQTVKVGQKIVIALDQNGGTGYSWTTTSVDEAVVKEVSSKTAKKAGTENSGMVGTPETVTTTYQAVAAGTTKIVLGHIPPGSDKAEETFTVTVTVTS